jgi:hypothetical protein
MFASVLDFFRSAPLDVRFRTITLILPDYAVPVGQLHTFNLIAFKRSLKAVLDAANVGPMISVLEFSLDECEGGDFPACWLPHAHGFVGARSRARLRRDLGKQLCRRRRRLHRRFRRKPPVQRPVQIESWDGEPEWASYSCKLDERSNRFRMRVDPSTGEIRYRSYPRRLRSAELTELLVALDHMGTERRFITRYCQVAGPPDARYFHPVGDVWSQPFV